MSRPMTTDPIDELQQRLRDFASERDWEQFHTPKNLAMAVSVEAAELLELFQWLTPQQSVDFAEEPEQRAQATAEIADVAIYLLRLADVLGIDVVSAIREKIDDNARRYPANVVRGRADVRITHD